MNVFVEVFVGHLVELGARGREVAFAENIELLGYGAGGVHVVARYHERLDACGAALGDGRPDFGTGRIYHAHEADEDHALFGDVVALLIGGGEHPERPVRHCAVGVLYLLYVGRGYG